jgi:hypothetical protein
MKLPTRRSLLAAAFSLTMASAPLFAAERVRAGEWEFTTSHDKGEASTFKHCITADEAGSVNGDTKSARAYAEKKAAGRCKVTDYKVAGDTVTYAIVCGTTSIRSTATYHGDSSEGDLITTRDGGAEVVSHVKARRLGNCP